MSTHSPLPTATPEARAAYPFPGFNGDSLETVRRLRTAFDAGRAFARAESGHLGDAETQLEGKQ